MTTRRAFIGTLAGALLAAPLAGEAQAPTNIPRIGILRSGSPPDPFLEAFKQGLRELGYVEGRNINLEYRWAEGRDERLPGLAAELVRMKVDVIVASGTAPAVAAKHATSAIPIVMPMSNDPVRLGLVASVSRRRATVWARGAEAGAGRGRRGEGLRETWLAIPRFWRLPS